MTDDGAERAGGPRTSTRAGERAGGPRTSTRAGERAGGPRAHTEDAYRWDELTRSWVVVTPSRRATTAFLRKSPGQSLPVLEGRCPFCPGNEADTETAIAAAPAPADGPWRVRVVHNKFPVARPLAPDASHPGFTAAPPEGEHEVVIESRDHDADLPDLDDDALIEVVGIYRDRLRALSALPGIASVVAFRNRGRRAGSSQPHPHGQILASRVVGPLERTRDHAARAFHDDTGDLLLASLLSRELDAGARIVEETRRFVVLCPFAPHQSRQTFIVPRNPHGAFWRASDPVVAELGPLLGRTLRRILRATGGVDYNLVLRSPPVEAAAQPHAFWFVDILPRSSGGAGYEHSTGIDIVVVPPEEAAAQLRAASPDR